MKKPKLVTRESLRDLVAKDAAKVIARALIVIYERQTSEEQRSASTRVRNGVGFSGADAELGTRCAKAALAGKLELWMLKVWSSVTRTGFPKICKYARQLNEIAESKRKSCNHIYSRSIGVDQRNRKCVLCGHPEVKRAELLAFTKSQHEDESREDEMYGDFYR